MTTYRKAELFEEILKQIYETYGDSPVDLVDVLTANGLTKEETISQIDDWGHDGEIAWEIFEEEEC